MEMILNENDIVVGASFENGTIQDYVNEDRTYGLIRIDESTVNWFLFNKEDSDKSMKKLYEKVLKEDNYIHNDFGEEIVLFNRQGDVDYKTFKEKVDQYLNDEMGNIF